MLESLLASMKELFLPIMVTVLLLGSLFVVLIRFSISKPIAGSTPFIFAFASLGGITGLIAGSSREAIVGGLLTGLLGLISALLSYLFSKESLKEWRPYIPFAIILLVINALVGLSVGGIYKEKWEQFDRDYIEWKLEYEKVYLEVLKEERLSEVRLNNKQISNVSGNK
ncbi:hypothetical protein [Geothrix limicola]|uniref:hypothetical protein n=1 Tax=Geothrix limicola TaxID=2927978 RepID=UPI0025578D01|nr:hypothetical protein [Geothrix limicola]